MKLPQKILLILLGALVTPMVAFAAVTVPWNRTAVGTITPLYSVDGFLVAASSTVNSTLSVSSLTSGNCVQAGTGGLLTTIASPCGSSSGSTFPFTPTSYGVSTSTIIGFLGGLFSTASSTFSGSFHLPSLGAGFLSNDANGNVYTTASSSLFTLTTTGSSGAATYIGNTLNIPQYSGGGSGTVSTSTNETAGFLAYWTSNSATPALLGKVATSTPTVTAPITYSGTLGSFVGGIAGAFACAVASGSQPGCLSSADWTTFNNKGSGTVTSVTGTYPVVSSGGNTPAISLAFGTTTTNIWSNLQTFTSGFTNSATSTGTFGINLSGGCFAIAGVCVTGGGASLTGTTGQTAYFSGTNTAVGTSTIFTSTKSYVGIATTTPSNPFDVYVSTNVVTLANAEATGGTITHSGGYTIHTFTSSGTFTMSNASTSVEYLVVAGGGGGGGNRGAGGGAGGMRTSNSFAISSGGKTVTIGAGGAGGTPNNNGADGADSVFSSVTSTGGGGGAGNSAGSGQNGRNGGSGGGAGATLAGAGTGGTGVGGQGNAGGNGVASALTAAGGGGAGAVGGDANASGPTGGNGGAGSASSISGASVTYAGGGGGGTSGGTAGTGGSGGGGNGTNNDTTAAAGTVNTGGGGGGGGGTAAGATGGAGGSGIVIVRYLTPTATSVSTAVPAFNVTASSTVNIGTSTPLNSAGLFINTVFNTAFVWMSGLVNSVFYQVIFKIDSLAHRMTGGPAPTCSTGCAAVVGDDSNMRMTTGSTVSSAIVTFANGWVNRVGTSVTPICTANEESGGVITSNASSTPSNVTINFLSAVTTKMVAVHCEASDNFTY